MAGKKTKPEVLISDLDIERRAKLLVAYSEYTRWMLSFPKRRNHTFTGAVIVPYEAMHNIALTFAELKNPSRLGFGLSFSPSEYGFLTEIGVYAAYWEESGLTLVLNSRIINLTSIPYIRLHFEIENHVQRAKAKRLQDLFLAEIVPNGKIHGTTGFKPTRLYPELIEIKSDYSKLSQPKNKTLKRILG